MSELRRDLENVVKGVVNGNIPIETAKAAQKAGHSAVMEKYATVKEVEVLGKDFTGELATLKDVVGASEK